jgi:hypothetical protein
MQIFQVSKIISNLLNFLYKEKSNIFQKIKLKYISASILAQFQPAILEKKPIEPRNGTSPVIASKFINNTTGFMPVKK